MRTRTMSTDRQMRRILARLELISFGSTQAWNASGGHSGEPDDRIVALVDRGSYFPHLHYRDAYNAAETPEKRSEVLEAATRELESWIKRADAPASQTLSFEDLVLEDGEGHPAEMVARHFNVNPAFIRRVRVRRGRSPEDGRQAAEESGDRAGRARELRSQGLSTRQIALVVGVHQRQVMRWLTS